MFSSKVMSNMLLCFFVYFLPLKCNKVQSEVIACQDIFTLLGSDKNVAKVIDVTAGATVRLYCHFCTGNDNPQSKFWYYKPRGNFNSIEKIIGLQFDNENKIYMTASHTLVVQNYNTNTDSGIYSCKSQHKADQTLFTYVLDGVFDSSISPYIGILNHWHEYEQHELNSVNKQFEASEQEPYSMFRATFRFSFRVKTYWEPWGLCEVSGRLKGIRKKRGKCRLQIVPNYKVKVQKDPVVENVNEYFTIENYDISCNSIKLNEILPQISRIVRNVPDYEATEPCTMENKSLILFAKANDSEFKFMKTKQLAEDGHCILICPEATQDSSIVWFKDGKLLNSSYRNNMGKNDEEPHLTIDSYNSLYIFHATKKEEGSYSCTNNGKKMQIIDLKIVPKDKLLNDDFFRYTIYLGFVLSLTMTCYCAGICVAWHGKSSFADPLNLNKMKKNQYQRIISE